MTERLLQFIWQFQYFNKIDLGTSNSEKLVIVHPGQLNRNQGPDFLEARIRIRDQLWVGSVELHMESSGWQKHSHHLDTNYTNVILHVVWTDDDETLSDSIPTLILNGRVQGILLQQYETWMKSSSFIPCGNGIAGIEELLLSGWKQRLVAERLDRKSAAAKEMLEFNHIHWEQTFWWMLAKNMGQQVNAEAFEEIMRSIPYPVLMKHRKSVHQIECLLLGQAGLLEGNISDHYALMLKKEFDFYKAKYGLRQINIPVHFLRMRPAAFPTIRLAQLAMIIHNSEQLFSTILVAPDLKKIKSLFEVTANDYWHCHFMIGEVSVQQPKALGANMISSIIVNTVVPLLFTYGNYHGDESVKARAIDMLELTREETNFTVRGFNRLGIKNKNAHDSQALLELKSQYCDSRRCLDCAIGYALLNS